MATISVRASGSSQAKKMVAAADTWAHHRPIETGQLFTNGEADQGVDLGPTNGSGHIHLEDVGRRERSYQLLREAMVGLDLIAEAANHRFEPLSRSNQRMISPRPKPHVVPSSIPATVGDLDVWP